MARASTNFPKPARRGTFGDRVCRRWAAALLSTLLYASPGFAGHPLITEDTGTQGRGNWQLELTAEVGREDAFGTTEDATDFAAVLSYGLSDSLDLLLSVPYSHTRTNGNGLHTSDRGLGDVGADLKWRFFEESIVSIATKGGLTAPTGDDEDGFGAGRWTYNINLVTSIEKAPWGFHIHLGYQRNRNVHGERSAIHHRSLALTREATEKLMLVADLGSFTTSDRSYDEDTVFLILGGIYALRDNLDLDFGVKRGLTDPETDTTGLLGLAIRF